MAYLYETHLHTSQGSKCGKAPGCDYIRKYKDLGYDGIFVTDHFFNGNCLPDRALPWTEWVNAYCRGYESAKEEGDKQGVQVFFGLEERFAWDEWLVYGLDKPFLLAHPEMRTWTRGQWIENVHAAGGCIVQAHPFRVRDYMNSVDPCLGLDGYEVANAGNHAIDDAYAARFNAKLGKYASAGSDIHFVEHRVGEDVYGVAFAERLTSVKDYVQRVLDNAPHTLILPEGRHIPFEGVPQFASPLNVYGYQGEKTDLTAADLF